MTGEAGAGAGGVTVSEEAFDLIGRSIQQANYDPGHVGVRIRLVGGELRPRFVPAPEPGDEVAESGEVRVFLDAKLVRENPGAQ
ncbi:MAG TPA: hypothetical protein VNE62_09430, partial [Actinomycetota bacterium]|nr:hypothetical protein [Actinomycetota bacterium]